MKMKVKTKKKMTSTPEKKTSRSLVYTCWRIIFAIVGILDCSCFCYCYYYTNYFSDENYSKNVKKFQSPKSCPLQEGLEENDFRQHLRKSQRKHEIENNDSIAKMMPFETPPSSKFRKKSFSSTMWQSMAFSHHPVQKKDSAFGTNNRTGTRKPFRRIKDNSKNYQTFLFIHLGFGLLCCIEMIIRAKEARRVVFENQAISAFEEHIAATVAKAYHKRKLLSGNGQFSYSTLRLPSIGSMVSSPIITRTLKCNLHMPTFSLPSLNSVSATTSSHAIQEETKASPRKNEISTCDDGDSKFHDRGADEDRNKNRDRNKDSNDMNSDIDSDIDDEIANKRSIVLFLRSTFRLWLPIGVTCVIWLSLLPFPAYYRITRIFLEELIGVNSWLRKVEPLNGNNTCGIDDCSHPYGSDTVTACYLETLGEDTAWATLWITSFLARWKEISEEIQDYLMSLSKRYVLGDLFQSKTHEKLHIFLRNRPKLIWFRLGRFLTIVKWVRFAGPLARMVLKLQDQLRANYSTFKNARFSKINREKMLQRPSLLLRDLKRIESLYKVEMKIAAWPSQCSMLIDSLAEEVSRYSGVSSVMESSSAVTAYAEDFLQKSRERGRQITRQIKGLQEQIQKGVTEFSAWEIYDNIHRLSQGVCKRDLPADHGDPKEGKEKINQTSNTADANKRRNHRSAKRRWYDFLHLDSLLSSRDYLISPRSRFSVVWRITVTNCLLLELTRLSVSWYLTQTFHLSFSQVMGRLFVDCGTIEEDTKRKFRFFTDLIEEWHVGLSRAIPFVPFPKESLWILCVPTSTFSKILLLLALAMETFVDIISFFDIFFWFFTGDLDASTGLVVPKAFFGRCILPGTLVQIIDHPTLPHFLPSVLAKLASVAEELGWSRLVLWSFSIVPALVTEVAVPLSAYFFRHYDETDRGDGSGDDLLMTCAESFGYLPTRSTQLLLERTAASLLLLDDRADEPLTSERQSSGSDEDDRDDHVRRGVTIQQPLSSHGLLRIPVLPRTILRESSVRFAKKPSIRFDENDDNNCDGSSPLHSAADFNIGLSLSSHALDEDEHSRRGVTIQPLSSHGLLRSPVLPRILTPPGFPMRTILRESSVRFAKKPSIRFDENDDYNCDGSSPLHSAADFNIGLSLSSHALDDL